MSGVDFNAINQFIEDSIDGEDILEIQKPDKKKERKKRVDKNAIGEFLKGDDLNFEITTETEKLVTNLEWLKSLSVEEVTFYKKWEEMGMFRSDSTFIEKSAEYKSRIWNPIDINDEKLTISEIESLNPTVVYCPPDNPTWNIMRVCCSTAEFNQSPGRFLKFIVTDGNVNYPRYLGLIAIASDVITITDRDKYIGWTKENKLDEHMLKHSAIGQTIVPTQPFGFNFLGGKLCAALTTSKRIRDEWENPSDGTSTPCKLVGMTTTSLYGTFSMYNGLKWWRPCGSSRGKILIKPDELIYKKWHDWLKVEHFDEYEKQMTQKEGVSGPVTGAKLRVLSMMFSKSGLKSKDFVHGFQRGVYYAMIYENGKEFLQNKIREEDLKIKPLFDSDTDEIIKWWKPRAIKRYLKLKEENRLNNQVLYYRDMIDMSYDDAKRTFFE